MGLGWGTYSKSSISISLLYVRLSVPKEGMPNMVVLDWAGSLNNSTSKKRGYRIIILSSLHMQSCPEKDESHTCLLWVLLSFPCWFNKELNIIKEKKGRKTQTLQTLNFRWDSGKYVFKKKELLKCIVIWMYAFFFLNDYFIFLHVSPKGSSLFSQWWLHGFSHKILPECLVWNIKVFGAFIAFFRYVIRSIYKYKKWR